MLFKHKLNVAEACPALPLLLGLAAPLFEFIFNLRDPEVVIFFFEDPGNTEPNDDYREC